MVNYPIIDTWCDLFTPASIKKNYIENSEMAQIVKWWRMQGRMRGWTPQEFAKLLDAVGVATVFVPVWQMRSWKFQAMLCGDMAIEEVAEVMAADPKRYKGMFGINPHHKMKGVRPSSGRSRITASSAHICIITASGCGPTTRPSFRSMPSAWS